MKEKIYCVYKHTCKLNNKVYIGVTSQFPVEKRWLNGHGYKKNILFWRAIQKYGWNNFEHEVLSTQLSLDDVCNKEIELIKKYKSNNPKYGYNIDNGGFYSGRMSDATRNKMRLSKLGDKNINFGKPQSESAKIKNRNSHLGVKRNWKISEEHKERLNSSVKEPVVQFSLDMEFISEYGSIKEAYNNTNILHICECCKNKRKTAGGYIWKYKKEINKNKKKAI